MILCEKKKMDGKCRLQIPTAFIIEAGGTPNGMAYVSFDEDTKEIKITVTKKQPDPAPAH